MSFLQNKYPRLENETQGNEKNISSEEKNSLDIYTELKSIRKLQNEQEKILKAQQLNQNILNAVNNPIKQKINTNFCIILIELIGDGKTQFQREVLSIIGLIAEQREYITTDWNESRYLRMITRSGLTAAIELIMIQEIKDIEMKQENIQYSEFILQLINTFFILKLDSTMRIQTFQLIKKVILSQITNLIDKLKQCKSQQIELEQNLKVENDELYKGMKIAIQILQRAADFEYNSEILDFFININFHEVVYPLIHINCQKELKCEQRIDISENEAGFKLQAATFEVLASLSIDDNVKQYLIKDNSVLDHIIPLIMSFSGQIARNNNKDILNEYILSSSQKISTMQTFSFQSIPVISGALHLFYILLLENIDQVPEEIIIPDFQQSLVNLTSFMRKMHLGANFDQQTAKIREFSLNCLQNINDVMYFDEQKELNNKKEYIKHSIESIACVGGNEEENVGIFCNTISSIGGYFSYLMVHSEQFPHASKILIEIENDLEEYGGQEEINCQQYTQEWQHNNFVSHSSIFSMRDILNVHKHISNEKSREQIDDEFEEDRNVRAVQELLEQEEDDASNEDGEFSNEEDDASIEEEVESIIIKK